MDKEINLLIDQYIDKFLSQEIVKQYFLLEKQINESQEIKKLQDDLRQSQKSLALSINDNELHKQKLIEYQECKRKFEENPIICNYNILKEEIYLKLKELENKIKE